MAKILALVSVKKVWLCHTLKKLFEVCQQLQKHLLNIFYV